MSFFRQDGVGGRRRTATVAAIVVAAVARSRAQQIAPIPSAPEATPLATLVAELRNGSVAVAAARRAADAATHEAAQATTLPDPHVTVQQLSVGSPRPFAGFSNSDFAYIGIGVSQTLPLPGTLRARGVAATKAADTLAAHVDVVRSERVGQLEAEYFELAFLQSTREILQRQNALAGQLETAAVSQYRAGTGPQQDVFRAQLERTKVLDKIATNDRAVADSEITLKRLLNRPQQSADLVAEPSGRTPWNTSLAQLMDRVRDGNPSVREDRATTDERAAAVELSKAEARPELGIAYMYQHTGSAFRDYYMLTIDVRFARRSRTRAALAEASTSLEQAKLVEGDDEQDVLAEAARQSGVITSAESRAAILEDALIPQAHAAFESGLSSYQAGHTGLESALRPLLDLLDAETNYQELLRDRAVAIARLEQLAGGRP